MADDTTIELIHYKNIGEWQPNVGDIIIKHGWFVRTKWFGVVNFLQPDGSMQVIKDGMMKLLVMSDHNAMKQKVSIIDPATIRNSAAGSYAIMQCKNGVPIWYV